MRIAKTGTDIFEAARLIKEGQLVAIPTETVYGLAANALNEDAVLKVFEAKNRPFFDPLIIHLADLQAVQDYAEFNDRRLRLLAENFWPGPLTLLLPKKKVIPDLVTSGLPQVAVRVPQHKLTLQLLSVLKLPLAAPSANPFGYVSPTEASHVEKQLGGKINFILDGGPCTVGLESTIVGVEEGNVCVYRLGGLPLEEIEKHVGKLIHKINSSSNPKAPGQLKNHYAPNKPLVIGDLPSLLNDHKGKKLAVITFGNERLNSSDLIVYNLSEKEDLKEAAISLFKCLRLADESEAEIVLCSKVPDEGLGKAINDRLRRAAVQ